MNEQIPSFGDGYAAYLELAQNAPDTIEGQQKLNRALIDLIQPLAKLAKVEVKSIKTDSTDGVYGQLKENKKALEKQQGRYLNAILYRLYSQWTFSPIFGYFLFFCLAEEAKKAADEAKKKH